VCRAVAAESEFPEKLIVCMGIAMKIPRDSVHKIRQGVLGQL